VSAPRVAIAPAAATARSGQRRGAETGAGATVGALPASGTGGAISAGAAAGAIAVPAKTVRPVTQAISPSRIEAISSCVRRSGATASSRRNTAANPSACDSASLLPR
jgi:hypothetical protein